MKKKDITDEQEILKSIKFGEYIIKGIERLKHKENRKVVKV